MEGLAPVAGGAVTVQRGSAGVGEQSTVTYPRVGFLSTATTGMAWFLASEAALLGSVMALYVLFASRFFGWEEGKQSLDHASLVWATLWLGLASLAFVRARKWSAVGSQRRCDLWVAFGFLSGTAFLVGKGIGYVHDWRLGFTPAAGPFWQFYFLLTGLHGTHVAGGLLGTLWVWRTARTQAATASNRWRALLTYWGFLDAVWLSLLVLFLRW